MREVQRLTAFGPKSNSFTISSAEAAVVEFVCQRSDRARDQINRKFRAIWLAQYDSLSKNPPLSLFEFHSLSLFRILLQLLYIFLFVRFIEREKWVFQYDSLLKNPPPSLSFDSFPTLVHSRFIYQKREKEREKERDESSNTILCPKIPPSSLFLSLRISKTSLSLFRILFQLLYILLLVRFIYQKREKEREMTLPIRFSAQKFFFPFSLFLSSNFKNSLSLTNLLQKFIFPHEFSSNSCTFSFVRFSFIKKERERFRPRCIQLIFQAKVIARLFSMLLSQVLMQRDSPISPAKVCLIQTGD